MPPLAPPEFPLFPPRHGGLDGAKQALPEDLLVKEILDFSISINPLGPPPGLRKALIHALGNISQYPEITAASLAERLAVFHGLSPDHVIVGNGTADLLFALVSQLPGKRALIPWPTFIEYEHVCTLYGWEIQHISPADTRDFAFDPRRIEAALTEGTTLFLCQPNNPTGHCFNQEALEKILEKADKAGAYVVLDEAFLPFTDRPSFIPRLRRHSGLIVLRSMTKSYAIPGLRLGYACASPGIISRWGSFLPPWNVNSLAQAAGIYCLEHGAPHLEASKAFILTERERITRQIQKIVPLTVLPSEANFFLVALDPGTFTADALYPALAKLGILIRHCGSFRGMDSRHIRIGLKSEAENQKLIEALRKTVRALASESSPSLQSSVDYTSRK